MRSSYFEEKMKNQNQMPPSQTAEDYNEPGVFQVPYSSMSQKCYNLAPVPVCVSGVSSGKAGQDMGAEQGLPSSTATHLVTCW